jgi:hypothetical protein
MTPAPTMLRPAPPKLDAATTRIAALESTPN